MNHDKVQDNNYLGCSTETTVQQQFYYIIISHNEAHYAKLKYMVCSIFIYFIIIYLREIFFVTYS